VNCRNVVPTLALVCALLVVWTVEGHTASSFRVGLHFENLGPVPLAIRDAAVAEAARIWTPYGVVLDAVDGVASCAAGLASLRVLFDLEPAVRESGEDHHGTDGLGVIRFDGEGAPESTTTIHYGAVTRIATSGEVMGLSPAQWPARLRDDIVARAVGRVLAHEVGHFLLRWPHHPDSGLMRGEFRASSLADPDDSAFSLTVVDRARFQIVSAAGLHAPAARSATKCQPIGSGTVAALRTSDVR